MGKTWAITLALVTGAVSAPARTAGESPSIWHFAVLLDGKRIGEHDFSVISGPGASIVDIQAHFKVKALFIPVGWWRITGW